VALSLKSASEKMMVLKSWAAGNSRLPANIDTDRHLVQASLHDVIKALRAFNVVSTKTELDRKDIRKWLELYVRYVLEFAIVLGLVLWPEGKDNFDIWNEQLPYLEAFDFDTIDKINASHVSDPTFNGVIPHLDTVPETYFPANPETRIFFRNAFAYGSSIQLWNGHRETQNNPPYSHLTQPTSTPLLMEASECISCLRAGKVSCDGKCVLNFRQ